jgi:3'-phosphoadenosine 5'-phosphosulfate sulfotransferase (PAPS reductase)/FAD synthetase
MGLRAQESRQRAKRAAFTSDNRASNGRRTVETWLPIHEWTDEQVWQTIRASGVPYHYAYDLGMPRLSCCFCIFAPEPALLLAGKHNPDLLSEYVRVEKSINHKFRQDVTLVQIQDKLAAGHDPKPVKEWMACA